MVAASRFRTALTWNLMIVLVAYVAIMVYYRAFDADSARLATLTWSSQLGVISDFAHHQVSLLASQWTALVEYKNKMAHFEA